MKIINIFSLLLFLWPLMFFLCLTFHRPLRIWKEVLKLDFSNIGKFDFWISLVGSIFLSVIAALFFINQ